MIFSEGTMPVEGAYASATEFATCSSTAGACYCGGTMDFSKEAKEWKTVLQLGNYKIQKYVRTLYWCNKCKAYI